MTYGCLGSCSCPSAVAVAELFGRPVMPLISDDCLKKVNDLVLSVGHDIELPAHLGEAVVDMCA